MVLRALSMCLAATIAVAAAGCGGGGGVDDDVPAEVDPAELALGSGSGAGAGAGKADGASAAGLPDVRCAGTPATGGKARWRHLTSWAIAGLGAPKHRGVDLAVGASSAQVLEGEISYGLADKALEDELVDLFVCRAGRWVAAGSALTDGEGRFSLPLRGAARLPLGLRDVYVSVAGDRTGARFVALVAPDGAKLAVSDVDGTLTSSENAFPVSLVTGRTVAAHARAPEALRKMAARGYAVVYLTSRGRVFTPETRAWLEANGFPRGALRLAPSFITLPGDATAAYKASSLGALEAARLDVALGIGNRASDESAYRQAGVAPRSIFLKLPEFADEVQPLVDAGAAVGFPHYAELESLF
jgi:hypothetical protein